MINTILFDLDGTLLPMDFDRFVKIYFTELGQFFEDLIPAPLLAKHIWASTQHMVDNNDELTNQQVFMDHFAHLIPGELSEYQRRFDLFYQQRFVRTRAATFENLQIRESLALLKLKGYHLVLATNPLFPEPALLQRIDWAGFKPSDFKHITTFEGSHYCKPQTAFYSEILTAIAKSPAECLMVGNDAQEDLVAAELGITTYLITDCLINRAPEAPINSDYLGDYQEFHEFATNLPALLPATG